MTFGIKLDLKPGWQLVPKKWSFIFNSIGTAILSYLVMVPDAVIAMYAALPDELKAYIPVKYSLYVTLTLYILGLLSQFIRQRKLEALEAKSKNNGTL